jgi:hypothetical protein
LQLNPSYETASTIQDLVKEGKLYPLCAEIFRAEDAKSIRLYRHQQEAVEKALDHKHFIVTSGTGSEKTLTYFVPIFDAILRTNPEKAKTRAIIVYPMNALVRVRNMKLEGSSYPLAGFRRDGFRENCVEFVDIFRRMQQWTSASIAILVSMPPRVRYSHFLSSPMSRHAGGSVLPLMKRIHRLSLSNQTQIAR